MKHRRFHYQTLEDIMQEARETGAFLPLSDRLDLLFEPGQIQGKQTANRLVIQPMEGCDGTQEGTPTELTRRRYDRFARGGAGLVWFESVAVVPEGRSSARQLMVTEKNLDAYKKIVEELHETSRRELGTEAVIIIQLTHSGRNSNPTGTKKAPIVAYHHPIIEGEQPLSPQCVVTDDELKRLEERFAQTARLCDLAGFDGVDLKACHGYLLNELLSAHVRPGMYGGGFENRIRFHLNALSAIQSAVSPACVLSVRLNAYDGFDAPYGFGGGRDGQDKPDVREPIQFAQALNERFGMTLLNVTCGNGFGNTHMLRPYDAGVYLPDEHPFTGLSRHMRLTRAIQQGVPQAQVVGSAYSYLRQFSPYLAAGMLAEGAMQYAGFGRMALAYPDFARDLREHGALDPKKVCVACSQCTLRPREGKSAGCVVRDGAFYAPVPKP